MERLKKGDNIQENNVLVDANEDQLLRHFSNNGAGDDTIVGAKIEGDYESYISIVMQKHHICGRTRKEGEKYIVIDSIDGAEHQKSLKTVTGLISFLSIAFTPSWINTKVIKAGSSLNILTWQQMMCDESTETMIPAIHLYMESKYKFQNSVEGRNDYVFYDLHDGKMIYLLTQHSKWNRTYKPFLLCSCMRRDGVVNNDTHTCTMIDEENQLMYRQRSQQQWDLKQTTVQGYDFESHCKWVDESNEGISHFGVGPTRLPWSSIQFDVFHLRCAVTRALMNWVRLFLLNHPGIIIDTFATTVLSKFWNEYLIHVWNSNKNFSSFQGNEIALFVGNVEIIVEFINTHISESLTRLRVCNGVLLWKRIFKFMSQTWIADRDKYRQDLDQFKVMLKQFYNIGRETFLSKNETFYMHALRFYIPVHAEITFEEHGLGIGIFSMQGFERRNKESKNAMRRSNNNKMDTKVITNLRKLHDVFLFDHNSY